jgi:hypothetical protein
VLVAAAGQSILDALAAGGLLYEFRSTRAGGFPGDPAIHDLDFEEGGFL